MTMIFAITMRDQIASDLRDTWNAELGSAAVIRFYDGTEPAACEDADDGTFLGEATMNSTPFDTPVGNQFLANSMGFGGVVANGTATYWRMKNAGGDCITQGDCGTTVGFDIVFDTTSWTNGQTFQITNFELTVIPLGV